MDRYSSINDLIVDTTSRYKVYYHRSPYSFTIVRLKDDCSVYLQGDDASQFDRELNAYYEKDLDIDRLFSEYDDVMG